MKLRFIWIGKTKRAAMKELIAPPHADARGRGWQMPESARCGRLARRLWDGLLSCEEVTTL